MRETINDNTRIMDLTVGELKAVILQTISPLLQAKAQTEAQADEYVYGIAGLAEILGCCRAQAQYIKNTGKYDEAITQIGRKIIINKTKMLKLIKQN